jgi:K+-sensing histidine kinase KdpD
MKKQVVLRELRSGETYRVTVPCILGRGKEADLDLPDPSVSHRHALITGTEDQLWIEDLLSRNGVFVNQEQIPRRTPLNPGDVIQLGTTQLAFLPTEGDEVSEQTVILHSLQPRIESQLDRQKLKLVYEITKELAETQSLASLGRKLFTRFKEVFNQDRGYLALFQEDGTLEPIMVDPPMGRVPLSRSIINRLFRNGESFLLADALDESSLSGEKSVIALKIRSALCVPMVYHSQIYGLFYLDRNVPGAYCQDDLDFLRTVSSILAPLIENARLWSELKGHYANVTETLRETQARLIEMERSAAYARLAQAMAHEIRNPLVVIGGLVRRMVGKEPEGPDAIKLKAVMESVERIETVLKEVDGFVRLPAPEKRLERVDGIIQESIGAYEQHWREHRMRPQLEVNTPHVMVPLDRDLFKKALLMIFREILSSVPTESELKIFVQHSGDDVEVLFGKTDAEAAVCTCGLFDPELRDKPWSLGLFLNIAHKIISDHDGKLLLDADAHSPFPLVVKLPRLIKA